MLDHNLTCSAGINLKLPFHFFYFFPQWKSLKYFLVISLFMVKGLWELPGQKELDYAGTEDMQKWNLVLALTASVLTLLLNQDHNIYAIHIYTASRCVTVHGDSGQWQPALHARPKHCTCSTPFCALMAIPYEWLQMVPAQSYPSRPLLPTATIVF